MVKVHLVGAGSGDVGLLTYKALKLLEKADVILYDRLLNPLLLYLTKADAELIDVGKMPGRPQLSQGEINHLMIDFSHQGLDVLRLKGGDPSIFGRVGEEMAALARAGIDYEVVPGVTAASSASIYADIPITQRLVAERVLILTPQQKLSDLRETDFKKILFDTTLVIYMGLSKLLLLQEILQAQKVSADMPIALIENGSYGSQKTLVTDVAHFVEAAKTLKSPSLIIIGQVVTLRKGNSWFEKLPDFQKRILYIKKRRPSMDELLEMGQTGADFWVKVIGDLHNQQFDSFDKAFASQRIDQIIRDDDVVVSERAEKVNES